MSIGFKIKEDNSILLGDSREELLTILEENNLKYKIMFDKVDEDKGVKETIISVPNIDIEISLENDKLVYLKSKMSSISTFKDIDIHQPDMKRLDNIINSIKNYFDVKEIYIKDVNLATFDIRVIIKDNDYRYRVHIMTTQAGESFIYTIKII